MSCLNLRLPPAKKAWKSFTSKLQSKLHKLHTRKSKAIKKPKHRIHNSASAKSVRPTIFFEKRKQNRKRPLLGPSRALFCKKSATHFQFYKKTAPVYVDKLFPEPVTELVAKFPPSAKNMKLLDCGEEESMPGSSRGDGERGNGDGGGADDMWESLALASPQMQGIDERAERFISSFRADMELQEAIARGL